MSSKPVLFDYAVLRSCGCCIEIGVAYDLTKARKDELLAQGYRIKVLPRQQASDLHAQFVLHGCPHQPKSTQASAPAKP